MSYRELEKKLKKVKVHSKTYTFLMTVADIQIIPPVDSELFAILILKHPDENFTKWMVPNINSEKNYKSQTLIFQILLALEAAKLATI